MTVGDVYQRVGIQPEPGINVGAINAAEFLTGQQQRLFDPQAWWKLGAWRRYWGATQARLQVVPDWVNTPMQTAKPGVVECECRPQMFWDLLAEQLLHGSAPGIRGVRQTNNHDQFATDEDDATQELLETINARRVAQAPPAPARPVTARLNSHEQGEVLQRILADVSAMAARLDPATADNEDAGGPNDDALSLASGATGASGTGGSSKRHYAYYVDQWPYTLQRRCALKAGMGPITELDGLAMNLLNTLYFDVGKRPALDRMTCKYDDASDIGEMVAKSAEQQEFLVPLPFFTWVRGRRLGSNAMSRTPLRLVFQFAELRTLIKRSTRRTTVRTIDNQPLSADLFQMELSQYWFYVCPMFRRLLERFDRRILISTHAWTQPVSGSGVRNISFRMPVSATALHVVARLRNAEENGYGQCFGTPDGRGIISTISLSYGQAKRLQPVTSLVARDGMLVCRGAASMSTCDRKTHILTIPLTDELSRERLCDPLGDDSIGKWGQAEAQLTLRPEFDPEDVEVRILVNSWCWLQMQRRMATCYHGDEDAPVLRTLLTQAEQGFDTAPLFAKLMQSKPDNSPPETGGRGQMPAGGGMPPGMQSTAGMKRGHM